MFFKQKKDEQEAKFILTPPPKKKTKKKGTNKTYIFVKDLPVSPSLMRSEFPFLRIVTPPILPMNSPKLSLKWIIKANYLALYHYLISFIAKRC